MAKGRLPEDTDVKSEQDHDGRSIFYPGVHIFRAREMSRKDWSNFGVSTEIMMERDAPPTTRWGPENDWTVPVHDLGFLTEEQLQEFVAKNGLEVREA